MDTDFQREWWCICRKYCKGLRRRLKSERTWYRHLQHSSEDEKHAIRTAHLSDRFRAQLDAIAPRAGPSADSERPERRPRADDETDTRPTQRQRMDDEVTAAAAPTAPGPASALTQTSGGPVAPAGGTAFTPTTATSTVPAAAEAAPTLPAAVSTPPEASSTVLPIVTGGLGGWQPRKMKTGRTLCAYRWIAQVRPGGTGTEFGTYWKGLPDARKKQYEEECKMLTATNGWVAYTTDVINMLVKGTLY